MTKDHKATVGRQVHLPLSRAFIISMKSVRSRFGRSIITASGIFLGVAFLVSVLTQFELSAHVKLTGGDPAVVKAQMLAAQNRQLWLAIMSGAVCTIGITNAMLMAVTERFKEIGTMKCLGALDWFVAELFLLEAMMMGVIASFVGWVVGVGGTCILAGVTQGWWLVGTLSLSKLGVLLGEAVAIGTALTFLATLAPAWRAAQMPPAAAMRAEV